MLHAKIPLIFDFLQRAQLNLPRIQAEARLQDDIKAIKTIAISVAAYLLCYGPSFVYRAVGFQKETLANSWFAFIFWYSLFISSAANPVNYSLRSRRCRSAFKHFLKHPFGSNDFKEKPKRRFNGEKRLNEAGTRKRNCDNVEGNKACEGEVDGSQTRQNSSDKRRNVMVMYFTKGRETKQ